MAAAPAFNSVSLDSDGTDLEFYSSSNDVYNSEDDRGNARKKKKPKKKTKSASSGVLGSGPLPGEDVLGKEMAVLGTYAASMAAWGSLVLLLVTTVFHIIAYSGTGWVWVYSEGSAGQVRRDVGLWQECRTDTGCFYFGVSQISDAHRATQAFTTMTMLVLFVAVVLAVLYLFFSELRDEPLLGFVLVGLHAAAALFLFLVMCIFGSRWADKRFNAPAYSGTLHWCYAFECLAFFSQLAATALVAYEVLLLNRKAQDTEQYNPNNIE